MSSNGEAVHASHLETMEEIKSYCQQSSIHGLHYIAGCKSFIKRVFWIINVVLGFSMVIIILREFFWGWENKPMTSTVSTVPIDQVPFPAISFTVSSSYDQRNYVPHGILQSLLNAAFYTCLPSNPMSSTLDKDCIRGTENVGRLTGDLARSGVKELIDLYENINWNSGTLLDPKKPDMMKMKILAQRLSHEQFNATKEKLIDELSKVFFFDQSSKNIQQWEHVFKSVFGNDIFDKQSPSNDDFQNATSVELEGAMFNLIKAILYAGNDLFNFLKFGRRIGSFLLWAAMGNPSTYRELFKNFEPIFKPHSLELADISLFNATRWFAQNDYNGLGHDLNCSDVSMYDVCTNPMYNFNCGNEDVCLNRSIFIKDLDQMFDFGGCCELDRNLKAIDLETILKMMSLMQQPISRKDGIQWLGENVEKLGFGSVKNVSLAEANEHSLLAFLSKNTQRVLGMNSFIYGYNIPNVSTFMRESKYVSTFNKYYRSSPESILMFSSSDKTKNSLSLHLFPRGQSTIDTSLKVSYEIHDPRIGSIVELNGQTFKPGYTNKIIIRPTVFTMTDDVRANVPFEKRNCLFPEENERLNFFKMYSRSNCLVECYWAKARQMCNCTPWYHPSVDGYDLCSLGRMNCMTFEPPFKLMGKLTRICDCPLNCKEIIYDIQKSEHPIEAEEYFQVYSNYLEFKLHYLRKYKNVSNVVDAWVRQAIYIEIELPEFIKSIVVFEKDVRFTWMDQISSFGKSGYVHICIFRGDFSP